MTSTEPHNYYYKQSPNFIYNQIKVIDKMKDMVDLLSMEPIEVLKLTDVHTFYTQASDCNCKTPLHTVGGFV